MSTAREALFENEAFIAWLIAASPVTRAAAAEFLGGGSADDMLREMYKKDTINELKTCFQCEEKSVFASLADAIRKNSSRPLPRLDLHHLQRLAERPIREALIGLLNLRCGEDEVIDRLFVADRLQETLAKLGKADRARGRRNAESIFYLLLPEATKIRTTLGVVNADWGRFLLRERWLSAAALASLEDAAGERQWIGAAEPSVLAQLIDEAAEGEQDDVKPHVLRFDAMAVNYLQARLRLASQELSNHSIEYARQALQKAPHFFAIRALPLCLEFHRGYVASAFRILVSGLKWDTVESLVGDDNLDESGLEHNPLPDQPFVVELGDLQPTSLKPSSKFSDINFLNHQQNSATRRVEIFCPVMIEGTANKELVLTCRNVPEQLATELKHSLEAVTPGEFLPHVESLSEGLRRFSIPEAKRSMDVIVASVRALIPELVQCLVLCKVGLRLKTKSPWQDNLDRLRPYLPFSDELEPERDESVIVQRPDINFPFNAADIRKRRIAQYQSEGRTIREV